MRRHVPKGRGSLDVVGVGIDGPPQTTLIAVECMRRADALFYLVGEPTTELWINRLNPKAATLADLYRTGKPRYQTYLEMTDRILSAVRNGQRVCAAFYGHPGVLVMSSHWAIRRAKREGYRTRMFPGVSADACLYADVGVNPGECGIQSYEASDFLLRRRRIDPTSNLVLWQVAVLGESSIRKGMKPRRERLEVLVSKLQRHYPRSHRVTVYEAPTFAASKPLKRTVRLDRLSRTQITSIATLFIPALAPREPDQKILRWFEEA
jgi:uncharacterized protein YabN with tetrapyrrole methylase and pyrophosphatase domain